MRRVMIFIDGSNVYHSMKEYGKKIDKATYHIDYQKLVNILKGSNDLIRTYYFASSAVPPIEQQTAFYTKLKDELKFDTHIFPLKYHKEKGVDVALAIFYLAFGLNSGYEEGILVTGDRDLETAVTFVKNKGPVTKVVSFRHSLSRKLHDIADDIIYLDDIAAEIEMK